MLRIRLLARCVRSARAEPGCKTAAPSQKLTCSTSSTSRRFSAHVAAKGWPPRRAGRSGHLTALTGLLFVAVSVKSDVLSASRSLSSRAAQTLVLFMTSVLTALVLIAPQPPAALGSELLAVAVVSCAVLLILDRRAGHGSAHGVARYIERFSPNTITAVLVGVAGLTFLFKAGGGLYWLIPAAVASLLGGVINAWLFLIKVTR